MKKINKNLDHYAKDESLFIIFLVFVTAGIGVLFFLAFYRYLVDNNGEYTFTPTPLKITLFVLLGFLMLSLVFATISVSRKKHSKKKFVVASSHPKDIVLSSSISPSTMASSLSPSTKKSSVSRFPTLSVEDSLPKEKAIAPESLTLYSLCSAFREYAAGTLGLFYSEADIRSFIASLTVSRIILLQGMSGTGKTSLPVAFGRFSLSPCSVVPVQPTWKERSDLLGYYNEFTGRFSETPLLKSLYEAGRSDAPRLIVLDELNIARVEYYFAEFLSLLELPDPSARKLSVAPSGEPNDPSRLNGGSLALPENVWFIGTANNDDSTFAISDKVYDRAMVLDLDKRAEPFPSNPGSRVPFSANWLLDKALQARREHPLSERDLRRVLSLDEALRKEAGVSFGNRIMRQIAAYVPAYVACGGTPSEALDGILARKVLRKVGAANPVLAKAAAPAIRERLISLFGEGGAKECEESLHKIENNG